MTDQAGFAFTPNVQTKRWRVQLADGSERTVSATAIAAGQWRQVEQASE